MEMNLIDSNFWGWPESPWHEWAGSPRHKWFTEKGHKTLQVELPGVKKDNISLYVKENDYLCLQVDDVNIQWNIGKETDIEKISADYKDGLLVISLPPKEALIKTIDIA